MFKVNCYCCVVLKKLKRQFDLESIFVGCSKIVADRLAWNPALRNVPFTTGRDRSPNPGETNE